MKFVLGSEKYSFYFGKHNNTAGLSLSFCKITIRTYTVTHSRTHHIYEMDTSLYPYIQTKLPCDKTKPIQINIPKTQICTVNQIKVKVETEETQRESMEPALTMISKPNTHLVNDRGTVHCQASQTAIV